MSVQIRNNLPDGVQHVCASIRRLPNLVQLARKDKTPVVPAGPPVAAASFDADKAKSHQRAWAKHLGVPVEVENSVGMKFVWIPPGNFMMGSPIEEKGRLGGEIQHKVTLTKGFYMGAHIVTQEEWVAVRGKHPSGQIAEKKTCP